MRRGAPSILIADVDTIWTSSMARLLEREGYRVLRARTGVDALYQARMRRPDLILLDPDLIQLNGWEVCKQLKKTPEMENIKIVLLTQKGEAAYRVGADGYLVKGGQVEPTLPPIRVFRHPAQGILGEFLHRHAVAA
jgi:DNA-binding response OmpR family regulator